MHDAAICVLKVESASETGIMKQVLEMCWIVPKLKSPALEQTGVGCFGIHTKTSIPYIGDMNMFLQEVFVRSWRNIVQHFGKCHFLIHFLAQYCSCVYGTFEATVGSRRKKKSIY